MSAESASGWLLVAVLVGVLVIVGLALASVFCGLDAEIGLAVLFIMAIVAVGIVVMSLVNARNGF